MFKKLLSITGGGNSEERRAELQRDFIRHEAKVGGKIFGVTPAGVRREFFCLDERTWVWHEEWTDNGGQTHVQTTRYDVRPDGILKSQHGKYQKVSYQEAARLRTAVHMYRDAVLSEVYSFRAA